jgi:outer membrane receptor protein involved in Fe transport
MAAWCVALLCGLASGIACAQAQEKAIEGRTSAEDQAAIRESIVVTARRRPEKLDTVPISVQVLADELQRIDPASFSEYAGFLPGLTWDNAIGVNGPKPTVRGISTGLLMEMRPLTQLYLGETPISGFFGTSGSVSYPDINPIDVDRIEFLRGPQGTLFGASAMGGALRFIPNAPALSGRQGWISASGSHAAHGGNGHDLSGVADFSLGEQTGVRVAGFSREAPGWIDNLSRQATDVNATRSNGGRGAIRTRAGDWTIDLRLEGQRDKRDGHNMDESLQGMRYTQARSVPEKLSDRWGLSTATLEWNHGADRFLSSTSLFDRRNLGVFDASYFFSAPFTPMQVTNTDQWREVAQELRFQRTDRSVDWLVGGFFLRRDYRFGQEFRVEGLDDELLLLKQRFRSSEAALFADASFRPNPNHELSAGVRVFRHSQESSFAGNGLFNQGPSGSSSTTSETGATPRASLSWLPRPGTTLYASVAGGYRPGGTNDQAIDQQLGCHDELVSAGYSSVPVTFHADKLTNYEIGARTHAYANRLNLSAALFHISWKDMQTVHSLVCSASFVENSGRARSDGFELEAAALPHESVRLALRAARANARFSEDVPNLGAKAGDPIAGVPAYTASASVTWFFLPRSEASLDYIRTGKSTNRYDPWGAPDVPPYGYANFACVHRLGPWELFLRLRNLTDAYARVSRHRSSIGQWDTTLPPRTLTLGARYAW